MQHVCNSVAPPTQIHFQAMLHPTCGPLHQQAAHQAAGRRMLRSPTHAAGASGTPGANSISSRVPAAHSPSTTAPYTCSPSPNDDWEQSSAASVHAGRRSMLLAGVAGLAAAALPAATPPAQAAITVTLRAKPSMKQYTLDGGYSITVPDTWALAYDRSKADEAGVQVLFGNFRTFETLSIAKLTLDQAGLGDAAARGGPVVAQDLDQLVEALITEQRDNAGTMSFTQLAVQPRTLPSSSSSSSSSDAGASAAASPSSGSSSAGLQAVDAEFVVAVCRGQIQEGLRGAKRCVGLNDTELQTITRHYLTTLVASGRHLYLVKGSAASERWPAIAADMQAALASFALAPAV